jgi:hypothetical protein
MGEKHWFWATLTLSSITIVGVVFGAWELVENRFFRNADYYTLHYLYITDKGSAAWPSHARAVALSRCR